MNHETVSIGSRKLPWPIVAAAIALAPLLAVGGIRHLNRGPAPAHGAMLDSDMLGFQTPAPPTASPEAMKLIAMLDLESNKSFGPSPMTSKAPSQPRPQLPEPVIQAKTPDPFPAQPAATPPPLTLTSVMSSSTGFVAVLSGKLRRVGDAIGNGYTIQSITADEVEVTTPNGDHATFRLKPRKPE